MVTKKIEKNIRYNEKTDTYYVQFNYSRDNHLRGFPTLENARIYRDTINKEKLKYKIAHDLKIIRDKELKDIEEQEPDFPYNAFLAVDIKPEDISLYVVKNFLGIVANVCTQREFYAIVHFYQNHETLQFLGDLYSISRERARQIIKSGMLKMKRFNYEYIAKERLQAEIDANMKSVNEYRKKLIEAFKEKGVITDDIEYEFGEVRLGNSRIYRIIKIEELGLSARAYNCLEHSNILTVNELVTHPYSDLFKIRNMGKKSAKEIKTKLNSLGYCFAPEEGADYD